MEQNLKQFYINGQIWGQIIYIKAPRGSFGTKWQTLALNNVWLSVCQIMTNATKSSHIGRWLITTKLNEVMRSTNGAEGSNGVCMCTFDTAD
jgi:hypothetical protein